MKKTNLLQFVHCIIVFIYFLVLTLLPLTSFASSTRLPIKMTFTIDKLTYNIVYAGSTSETQKIDVAPIIKEGRTLLPIRFIAEPLGAKIEWDSISKKVSILLGPTFIELWIDKSIATVNKINIPIDSANPNVVPIIEKGRTLLPLRFIAENLGLEVKWESAKKEVIIEVKFVGSKESDRYHYPTCRSVISKENEFTIKPENRVFFKTIEDAKTKGYIPCDICFPLVSVDVSVSPSSITRGQSATLSWSSTNSTSVSVTPSIGISPLPLSGSTTVSPSTNTTYIFTATGPGGTAEFRITLTVMTPPQVIPPPQVILSSPTHGATNVSTTPTLSWQPADRATSYQVWVSRNSAFTDLVFNQSGITSTSVSVSPALAANTQYWWAVRGSNTAGNGPWSLGWTFTTSPPTVIPPPQALYLIADDGKRTYLGKLTTNKFDSDSIFNEFGSYGSKYSTTSIWNEYGTYGSKYSIYSAFNPYTTSPPIIIDDKGTVFGRLTVNKYVWGAISPYEIYSVLKDLGL